MSSWPIQPDTTAPGNSGLLNGWVNVQLPMRGTVMAMEIGSLAGREHHCCCPHALYTVPNVPTTHNFYTKPASAVIDFKN